MISFAAHLIFAFVLGISLTATKPSVEPRAPYPPENIPTQEPAPPPPVYEQAPSVKNKTDVKPSMSARNAIDESERGL